jgi:hypothetical protein
MRFTLLEKPGGIGRFKRVRAPSLGRWKRSVEGVRTFGYSQEVRNLADGSAYRMLVRYHWYGEDGKLLRRARRVSRVCRMFLPFPDLRVSINGAQPTSVPGRWRYDAVVRNVGHARALNVAVRLSVDGTVARTKTITSLRIGEAQSVQLRGPVCKNDYSFQVDPDDAIVESDEANNEATAFCVPVG